MGENLQMDGGMDRGGKIRSALRFEQAADSNKTVLQP